MKTLRCDVSGPHVAPDAHAVGAASGRDGIPAYGWVGGQWARSAHASISSASVGRCVITLPTSRPEGATRGTNCNTITATNMRGATDA